MRELKFRGITLNTNEWVYGSLLQSEIDVNELYVEAFICERFANEAQLNKIKVDPKTVGQFTGLRDKNGIDIYEGDICRIEYYDEGFKNGQVVFRDSHSGYYLESDFGQISMGSWGPEYIEVIGNIHQNPELL